MNIIEFAESINFPLYPVQKVIVKLIYGVQLDDTTMFAVPQFRAGAFQKSLWMTEVTYVAHLMVDKRLNRHVPSPQVVLVMGRGAGKSHILTLVAAYEVFHRLNTSRIVPSEELATLGVCREQAWLWFQSFSELAHRVPVLAERIANDGRDYLSFQRAQDIEESGPWKGSQRQAHASISVRVRAANPTRLRGRNLHVVMLDDFAHFPAASTNDLLQVCQHMTLTSGSRVFMTGTPSIMGSSAFREAHDQGMAHTSKSQVLRVPTWEAVSNLSKDFFEAEYVRAPDQFHADWGAEFLDNVSFKVPSSLFDNPKAMLDHIMRLIKAGVEPRTMA